MQGPALHTERHYPWLDGLRFFAATSVLAVHLITEVGVPMPRFPPFSWLHAGFWGVDIFFVISGAVMVLSINALRARAAQTWRLHFCVRRVARIVPLYLVTCAAYLLLIQPDLGAGLQRLRHLLTHALFIHNWWPDTHGSINGPSWSLGVEMQFYALLVLVAGWLLARPGWITLLLAALCTWGWRVIDLYAVEAPASGFIFATQLPGVLLAFAAGMVVARRVSVQQRSLPAVRAVLLLGLLIAGWLIAVDLLFVLQADYWEAWTGLLLLNTAVCGLAAASVALAMRAPMPGPAMCRALRWGGDLSYGIYLWHFVALMGWRQLGLDAPLLTALLIISSTALLALAGWWLVEKPAIAWARRHASPAGDAVAQS